MTVGVYGSVNTERFLAGQERYFSGCYDEFTRFGGPCVYFHSECLSAREAGFLSHRHIEMLYATLTAWGPHRMGDSEKTKTKLANWEEFQKSLTAQAGALREFARHSMLDMYTIRFFEKEPEKWLNSEGKFNTIGLPTEPDAQFERFHSACTAMKRLPIRSLRLYSTSSGSDFG